LHPLEFYAKKKKNQRQKKKETNKGRWGTFHFFSPSERTGSLLTVEQQ